MDNNLEPAQNNNTEGQKETNFSQENLIPSGEGKDKKTFHPAAAAKAWLIALTAVFTASMLCGVYLISNGPSCPAASAVKTAAVDEDGEEILPAIIKAASKGNGAAVIKIRGAISEGNDASFSSRQSASAIARKIRTLADKKETKALLLDINSPGGTVAAVQDIYESILYFKSKNKPVVALFRDVAASGAFYIAMAADKVVAQEGTLTGSIGVIMQTSNVEGLFDKIGVKVTPIKSGKNKDIGAIYRPMTEEEKALLQDLVNDAYGQFFNVVAKGRPNIKKEDLVTYADGRVFTGAKAKELGLIDGLGGEETARQYLSELTGIKDIKLLYPKTNNFMDFITLSTGGFEQKLGLAPLEEMASPRLSYLWTI
jgi:protease-4